MRKGCLVMVLALILFIGMILPSSAQEKKEIVIGMTLCLTGRYAVDVGPFDKMVKAWENYVNKKEGGYFRQGLQQEASGQDDHL